MCANQTNSRLYPVWGAVVEQLKAKKAAQQQAQSLTRPIMPVKTPPTGSLLGTPLGA